MPNKLGGVIDVRCKGCSKIKSVIIEPSEEGTCIVEEERCTVYHDPSVPWANTDLPEGDDPVQPRLPVLRGGCQFHPVVAGVNTKKKKRWVNPLKASKRGRK